MIGDHRIAGGLAYRVDGDGPVALLLHPAFTHSGAFDGEVAALAGRLRLVRVDLPGHGVTATLRNAPTFQGLADRLVAVLDAEGVRTAEVLGVSLGSLVGQDLARRHPDRVRSLTALGGYEVTDGSMRAAQAGAILGLLPRLLLTPARFARHVARLSAASPAGQDRFAALADGFRFRHLLQLRGQDELLQPNRSDRLRAPLLIVVGEHDLPLAHDASRRWHAREPGSQHTVIGGAGHCAHLDEPSAFQAAWLRWLS